MRNLPTLTDAETMYDLLNKLLCKNASDISLMCDKKEYLILTQKKGKPLQTAFELAVDFTDWHNFEKDLSKLWRADDLAPKADWKAFSARHSRIKQRMHAAN